jgi:hypothetical protein
MGKFDDALLILILLAHNKAVRPRLPEVSPVDLHPRMQISVVPLARGFALINGIHRTMDS